MFDVDVRTINEHLQNLFTSNEIDKTSTVRKFRIVQTEGKRQVERNVVFYNLDAIISVGYRVNSVRATQFRQWSTQVLKQFAIRGYVIDKKRLENGKFLGKDYFEHLLSEIREIRLSERRFYQKLTDIYATSIDYNKDAPTTKTFFAKVQNKLHFNFGVNQQIIKEVSFIDSFRGKWNLVERKENNYLKELRRIATIESIGSPTRIEGVQLTNNFN